MAEQEETKEIISDPANTWVFDVDGVITDLVAQEIKKPEILDFIQRRLNAQEPVALVTGRPFDWLKQTVLSQLDLNSTSKDNLFISAEFGGVTARYHDDSLKPIVDESLSLPPNLQNESISVLNKYLDSFVRENKQTLLTYKIKDGVSLDQFKKRQAQALTELKEIMKKPEFANFELHGDTIAINIRNKDSNKRNSIKKLLDWLADRGVEPQSFTLFGDSPSDLEMGEELDRQNKRFSFVYVGESLETKPLFPIIAPHTKHDEGTLEFLETL